MYVTFFSYYLNYCNSKWNFVLNMFCTKKDDFHTFIVVKPLKGLPLMLVVHFVIIAQLMLRAFFRKLKIEFC